MSETHEYANRLNMRRLRAGGDLAGDVPRDRRAASTGELASASALTRAFETAVAAATAADEVVMSFELSLRPLQLAQWGERGLPPDADLIAAIATRCCELDDRLVFLPSTSRVVGFAPGLVGQDDAGRLASALLVGLRRPFDVSGVLTHFEVRIGTAVLSEETPDVATLEAASASTLAATTADTPFLSYSARLKAERERDDRLRADLGSIVANGELELVYQPILETANGAVSGIEVFARWSHPEVGTLPPAEFLRLAESSERIYEIGDHVLATAFATVAGWADEGLIDAVILWVNVTPTELLRSGFKQRVREIIAASDAVSLGLDLLESPVVREKTICDVVRSLALDDVRASLDGFGGSLFPVDELARLPYDTVKMSRDVVAAIDGDPDGRDAAALVAQLANRHKLNVVATGVETMAQLELVRSIGVGEIQGHLASHPLSADEMRNRLFAMDWLDSEAGGDPWSDGVDQPLRDR